MKELGVIYVRFFYDYDVDGKIILIAKRLTDENLVINKSYHEVKLQKTIKIRIPIILNPYIGKIIQYRYEEIFRQDFEVFRIRPVDFNFDANLNTKKLSSHLEPYFTGLNKFIIPKSFVIKYFDRNILSCRADFNRNTDDYICNGNLLIDIVRPPKKGTLSFFLVNNEFSLCTKKMYKLNTIIKDCGRKLCNFKFESLHYSKSENFKGATMFFKEDKIA